MVVAGVTVSQRAFEEAMNVVGVLLSTMILSPGGGPPKIWVREMAVGVAVMDGATVFTEKVTGMETVLAPAVTRMEPCMFPADSPAALAETVSVLVVVAEGVERVAVSQAALVETVNGVETLLVKATVFESGRVPPRV